MYLITDFSSQLLICAQQYADAGYGGGGTMANELNALATALGTDPTTHDLTLADPGVSLRPGPGQTRFMNDVLLLVNTAKGGNNAPTAIAAAITAGISQYVPPANTAAPVASGTGTVGQTLSCTAGTWTNSPTGYGYQWLRGGANIAGANAASYTLVVADAAQNISCSVTASNPAGSASATSNAIAVAGAPVNTLAPVASGAGTVGSTLNCTAGTWTNAPTYAYQWLRGGANIAGATASSYLLAAADSGTNVSCRVTATNPAGAASATSNAIAVA